jgi:hypothetical protein
VHHSIHGFQEFVAPGRFAVLLETCLCVSGHGKGVLLHGSEIYSLSTGQGT